MCLQNICLYSHLRISQKQLHADQINSVNSKQVEIQQYPVLKPNDSYHISAMHVYTFSLKPKWLVQFMQ